MRKLLVLTALALMAATVFITNPVDSQSAVDFERQRGWLVVVDTDVLSVHQTRADAEAAATEIKLDQPDSFVAYSPRVLYVASVNGIPLPTATQIPTATAVPPTRVPATPVPATPVPSTPVPSTPVPPIAVPTVPPTATAVPPTPVPSTPVPTAAPTATAVPTPEPTATAVPTPAPTPTSTPAPTGELVWGYDETAPQAGWTKPDLLVPYVDPAYGSIVTRVTSADGTRFNRNTYSRRQAENADGTAFMTYHGSASYYVYDRVSGAEIAVLPAGPDSEPQWHPTNPSKVRYVGQTNSYYGALELYEVDIFTGQVATIADFTDRIQAALPGALYVTDRAEGSPSADGNRYAWLVYNAQEDIIGLMSYDLATDQILGVLPADQLPDAGFLDAISMSPTGRYVLTQHYDGTYVYDADLTNERLVFAGAEHSDIALAADGSDAYVYIDFTAGANGGWLVSVNLDTLAATRIFDVYDGTNTSIHISGKGYNKPGWAIVSTYSCKVDFGWACTKVMAVELAPNGRVLNLAHTYNCGDSYWTETHAAVNRDFTRVYFNSDSGSCGIDAEVMLIDVPNFN